MGDSRINKAGIRGLLARFAAVALHVFLLVSAFPPFMSAEAAWVAFVPLILLARFTCGSKRTFLWGWASGTIAWLFLAGWLLRLAITGGSWLSAICAWFALAAYCGLYTGLFVMLASHLFELWIRERQRDDNESVMGRLPAQLSIMACLPLLWVGLEYLRGHLFTGFPWNGLGVSQFRNVGLIQIASWGGVYAVSAVVMLVNAGMSFMALRLTDMFCRRNGPRFNMPLLLAVGSSVVVWLAGINNAKNWQASTTFSEVRIAAVQPSIPQVVKWEPDQDVEILDRLSEGTDFAQALNPDLVIWPETACPELVNTSTGLGVGFPLLSITTTVPVLAGAIEYDLRDGRTNFYNSSMLYMPDGSVKGVYRKIHLVPFGEYIPMESIFPSLSRYAPLGFSCARGNEMTVFELPGSEIPFSTLICFEDVFPGLSRMAVKKGAKFLVNQTNDAWFDGSSASVQHLANAVFRCVENRVSMVRCANTGVTCFISPLGHLDRATEDLLDKAGRVEPEIGNRTGGAAIAMGAEQTFYTRYGDLGFALPCAVGTIIVFALAVIAGYRKNRAVLNEKRV